MAHQSNSKIAMGNRKIKAVIFDMDGVISDTQDILAVVERDILKGQGIDMSTEEITRRFAGMSSRDVFTVIFSEYNKDLSCVDELIEERKIKTLNAIRGNVKGVSGTKEFIDNLLNDNFQLAVASGSIMPFIDLVLSELNLKNKFSAIVSSQEVENGKPDPAVFLLAAQRLGVAPEECLVVEDGANGMIAARRAGMKCIGLVREERDNQDYQVDLIVKDLRDVEMNFLTS